MKKLAIALLAIASIGVAAKAAYAASANGNANGRIRQAVISIVEATALDFGEVVASGVAGAGTVVLTPAGVETTTGGIQSGAFPVAQGVFDVAGNRPTGSYVVTFPGAPFTLACTTVCLGADPTVDTFTYSSAEGLLAGNDQAAALSVGPTPIDTLSVGGTLNFDPVLNDGDWAGVYVVDVVYN